MNKKATVNKIKIPVDNAGSEENYGTQRDQVNENFKLEFDKNQLGGLLGNKLKMQKT